MVHDTPSRQKARDMKAEASALQKEARTLATIPRAPTCWQQTERQKIGGYRNPPRNLKTWQSWKISPSEMSAFGKARRIYPRADFILARGAKKIKTVYLGSCRRTGRGGVAMAKARKLNTCP